MPIMYLDTVTDGMLRGLGQQLYSMKYNVIDSVICLVLVYILLPKYGVYGYIFILYFSEIFNFILSIRRLNIIAAIRIDLVVALKSLLAAAGAGAISIMLMKIIFLHFCIADGVIITAIIMYFAVYMMLLILLKTFDGDAIRYGADCFFLKRILKR